MLHWIGAIDVKPMANKAPFKSGIYFYIGTSFSLASFCDANYCIASPT